MKIEKIEAIPVNIPLEAPYLWSGGASSGFTKVIVKVFTDDGLVGLGEAPSAACLPVIVEELAPKLVGCDPLDLARCTRLCLPEVRALSMMEERTVVKAFGGLEIALWDLKGKAWQKPLYLLLGGAHRTEVAFCEYFAPRLRQGSVGGESSPGEIASYCATMQEQHGSTFFEGKCFSGDPHTTIQMVREVREAVGERAVIRLDANMGFTLASARHLLSRVEDYNLANIEDPVLDLSTMAKLREHTWIPFSTHSADLPLAVRLGVPDAFVLNLSALGGISRTLTFISACEEMGLDFWFYSGDAGIMTAAYLHVGAALAHIHLPSQSLGRWQTDDVIEEGIFRAKDNVIPVPDGPGLGVHLSESALQRCHQRFLDEGPYDHYYNPTHPGRHIRLPVG